MARSTWLTERTFLVQPESATDRLCKGISHGQICQVEGPGLAAALVELAG